MHHHHDISAGGKGLAVAGLLIAPIAVVGVVNKSFYAETPREGRGLVLAGVIHKNLDVHQIGQIPHSLFQSLFRIVCRHDYRNALSVDHWLTC